MLTCTKNMHFILSRQVFFSVAAICMCTWIVITFLVIKNGSVDKKSKEVFAKFQLDTTKYVKGKSDEQKYQHDELKWTSKPKVNVLHENINQADVSIVKKYAHKSTNLQKNNKIENYQTNKEKAFNDNTNLQRNKRNRTRDKLIKHNTVMQHSNYIDKNEGIHYDNKIINLNVGDKQRENNHILKWNRWQNKNNINIQKINTDGLENQIGDDNENDEVTKLKSLIHEKKENYVNEDSEETDIDEIAKYRNINDVKNVEAHNLDDGDDNDEIEDVIGDENENNEISNENDGYNFENNDGSFQQKNVNFNNDRIQAEIEKGDILQQLKEFPKVEPLKISLQINNTKTIEKGIKHGYQPFANFKNFRQNEDKMLLEQSTKNDESDRVEEDEIMKNDHGVENNNATLLNQVERKNIGIKNEIHENGDKLTDNGGLGEMGEAVNIDYDNMPPNEKHKLQQLYKIHGFNAYVSDMISVNRSLPDIRSKTCKQITYDINPETTDLPETSVIIVFHNEALSTLMRTIYSVINRSPFYLLKEIIIVDDFSTLDDLKMPLTLAISKLEKVRLIRTTKHEGLIRARLIGTRSSTAPVLTFLDAHVECFEGWLEPLLKRLVEKSDTVVCPQLQTISSKTFKLGIQNQVYVGSFQLSDLVFDWIPIQYMDKQLMSSETDTVRSPVFAGGQFSIYKSYFNKIGSYDKEMNLWGGENLELSFRVWMCGGSVEIHPCSNVAHVFRQTNPLEVTMKAEVDNSAMRNNLRTAHVWMDEFKKFYTEKGIEKINIGNIADRIELRKQLHCMSFQWYIDNVYPGLYVPGQAPYLGEIADKHNEANVICRTRVQSTNTKITFRGERSYSKFLPIRNPAYDLCIDSGINVLSAHIGVSKCSNITTQFWHLSKLNALQRELGCIEYPENMKEDKRPTLERCDGGGPKQYWVYTKNGWLYNPDSHLCLGLEKEEHTLQMLKCENNENLIWGWYNNGMEEIFAGR